MAKNFPNLIKKSHKFRKHRVPIKMNPQKPTLRHIIIKTAKVKDKKRIFKAARERQLLTRELS